MKARTMFVPRRVTHMVASWHSKARCIVEERRAQELYDPPFIHLQHRVRSGMRHGEVSLPAGDARQVLRKPSTRP